ncbi:hypothetical protein OSB04_001824 [Centaurea solstitialis]|uniref:Uncharacterized protein n=1 Tax=Centaurea solstitialis TaxID=347529 RepID=A0AA38TRP8_9ASTR|nr:hypothetical protein OSB04_001824 [Centaurea solstitialis]
MEEKRDWLQMHDEIMGGMILQRLDVDDILMDVQRKYAGIGERFAKIRPCGRSSILIVTYISYPKNDFDYYSYISYTKNYFEKLCKQASFETEAIYEGRDVYARAIAKSMPTLRHLKLFGLMYDRNGVQAILNGCPHLQSLDLCGCPYDDLDLDKNLVKLCRERIKDFKYNISESDEDSDTDW